jgi:hypothetical protein
MKAFTICLLPILLFSIIAKAQIKEYPVSEDFDKTFTKCEHPPTFGNDSLALQQYFTNELKNESPTIKGKLKVRLIIDTTGKTKCIYVENNSSLDVDKINFLINNMPHWNCAYQNNRKVTSLETILFTFKRKDLTVINMMGRD